MLQHELLQQQPLKHCDDGDDYQNDCLSTVGGVNFRSRMNNQPLDGRTLSSLGHSDVHWLVVTCTNTVMLVVVGMSWANCFPTSKSRKACLRLN